MSFSFNCLLLGETSYEKIFQVTIPEYIISDDTKVFIREAQVRQFKIEINIDDENKVKDVFTVKNIKRRREELKAKFMNPADKLINDCFSGEFVALYGAWASRKSIRMDQAMIKLESEGYVCICISFEGMNVTTTNTFWSAVGTELCIKAPQHFKLNDVKSADDFKLKLQKEYWNGKHVVLFIDEYDVLLEANDDIKFSFFGVIHNIKNSKRNYAIWSSVAIGPLSILFLRSDKINVSPFNIKESFRNLNFTLTQVESLYKDYENDDKLIIVPEVIKDIYEWTNRHAGIVCLYGKAIKCNLVKKLDERRCLDFILWSNFVASSQLTDRMIMYSTFRNIVDDLLKPDYKKTMVFLRSVFLGSFDFVQIHDNEKRRLTDCLTTQGVLIRENVNEFSYRMSSIFVDGLIHDIIIVTSNQKVVLELLASATKKELNEHFERVLHYAEMLSASDIWIVNFSCEDDATKKPYWLPNDRNFESVNVAHFFHDQKFENVRISAQYISSPGTFSYITDQVIQLQ
ncbi:9183_t:CDS:2 [Funneliformis mosseae]|uniref:9183_t:CDS:1 n=1 Tax=Funneliformis mosseae TaxID=27381 RepID=A0A9N9AUU0_FUNMO|nr:9183_t:CDS:2 [Funneliformis mosseae]